MSRVMTPKRAAWFALGLATVGIGAVGVIVPLLPTTPFVLFAAFAFARSSDRWHAWLMAHPMFGPMIEHWRAYGAISRPAKSAAIIAIAAVLGISVAIGAPPLVLVLQGLALSAAAVFILSRPLPPPRD